MASKKIAVIGSGFGGLAAAIRLQALGFNVTIFEARDKPGGRAYVYEQDGFTFDAGPTVITAPHCLEELWSITGETMADDIELLPVTPAYRLLWSDGDSFDYDTEGTAILEQIARRSKEDADGYQRFVEYSRKVFDEGYTKLAATPFLNFSDMIKVAPQLAKLRADRSVYSTVAKYVQDEKLRQALSFHALLVGGNPFETSAIYTLIHYLEKKWGVSFPRGGTGALIKALVRRFEKLGGDIKLKSPAERINVINGKHEINSNGKVFTFDAVISNADVMHTYNDLYKSNKEAEQKANKLKKLDWSMSLFVMYFGTNRTYDHLAHHTVIFGPRYKELLKDIFHGSHLADDFSLYLHYPTITDPSLAPPGHGTFYVLSPVPHLGHANIDWSTKGKEYGDKILAALETHIPDLTKHVVTRRDFTPQDFHSELSAHNGSAFSCAPTLTQSAWFRPHNRDSSIPGLYLVGAGTHPGAGVPGVVNSAKATAATLARDFGVTP